MEELNDGFSELIENDLNVNSINSEDLYNALNNVDNESLLNDPTVAFNDWLVAIDSGDPNVVIDII